MSLTHEDVVRYLLSRKWITNQMVVEGDLSVVSLSRRNSNFKVSNGSGRHYFLKHETRDKLTGDRKFASIAYEATVYQLLTTIYADRGMLSRIPRYFEFDLQEQVLLLESGADWVNLADYYLSSGQFPCSLAAELGATLADLHKISEGERARVREWIGVPDEPPWVFFLPEPDEWLFFNASLSNLELIKILQNSEQLCRSFDHLRCEWQNSALIHGDLKCDNCIVSLKDRSTQAPKLLIVDWELARLGDPCWDVGTIFSEYLYLWLSSVPISAEHAPDQFLKFARFPLRKLQPALRAFWSAYQRRMRIPTDELATWLQCATSFAAIRLVQTTFEQLQTEAAISTKAIFLLQLSANILARPLEASVYLLGLPLPKQLGLRDERLPVH